MKGKRGEEGKRRIKRQLVAIEGNWRNKKKGLKRAKKG